MKLWILRPIKEHALWTPWYDKAFGFVVRAKTEKDARTFAAQQAGDEGSKAWLEPSFSTCEELRLKGDAGVVIIDFAAA